VRDEEGRRVYEITKANIAVAVLAGNGSEFECGERSKIMHLRLIRRAFLFGRVK